MNHANVVKLSNPSISNKNVSCITACWVLFIATDPQTIRYGNWYTRKEAPEVTAVLLSPFEEDRRTKEHPAAAEHPFCLTENSERRGSSSLLLYSKDFFKKKNVPCKSAFYYNVIFKSTCKFGLLLCLQVLLYIFPYTIT